MLTTMNQPIRMLMDCQYGIKGSINSTLDWGMRSTLVEYNRAEWVVPEAPAATSDSTRKQRKDSSDKGN